MCKAVLVMTMRTHKEYPCGFFIQKGKLKKKYQNATEHNIQFIPIKDTHATWTIVPYIEAIFDEEVVNSIPQEKCKQAFDNMWCAAHRIWNRYNGDFDGDEATKLKAQIREELLIELKLLTTQN